MVLYYQNMRLECSPDMCAYLNLETVGGHMTRLAHCPVPLVFHCHSVSMYGPNYGGGHHNQSSSRPYQNPNQPGGGYSSGSSYNADPQLLQWFNAVDTDRSGSISVAELQAALVNGQRSFLIFPQSWVDGSRNDTGNWSSECSSSSSSELENRPAPSPHQNAPFLLKSPIPVLIQSCNLRI
jgi:hypothetical protein